MTLLGSLLVLDVMSIASLHFSFVFDALYLYLVSQENV